MKIIVTFSLLVFSLFMLGCASTDGVDTASEEAPTAAPAAEKPTGAMTDKTAYDGTTGSGLLMERYKSGQIEGYRN